MSELKGGYMIDPRLLDFAKTDIEIADLIAYIKHGNQKDAAKERGKTFRAISKSIMRVKRRAAKKNFSTEFGTDRMVPEGFTVKKIAKCFNKDGELSVNWISAEPEKERQWELLKEAVEALSEPIKGLAKPIKSPCNTKSDIMSLYPVAEPHIGMYAWADETGNDYDVSIAENLLMESMTELVETAPNTKEAVIFNLADYFHIDDESSKTKQSGNVLDSDGRWAKVFRTGVKAHREMINLALKKHDHVTVKSGLGNHDKQSIFCLMEMMGAYFENEPRVTIHSPISPYSYHVFGKNLLGLHHGNGLKVAEMPMLMADDMAEAWGKTVFRHFLYGHIHHKTQKAYTGCTTESFRSIASRDSWHHASGYRADRGMERIDYHADGGIDGRKVKNIFYNPQ